MRSTSSDINFIARGPCALCGSEDLNHTQSIDVFDHMKCQSCGFVQVGQIMSEDDLSRYYESGYSGDRLKFGQLINSQVNLSLLLKKADIARGAKVLDVGCGYGFLLDALRSKLNIQPFGLELATSEVEFAQKQLGLDVRYDLEDFKSQRFDVITMFEVIEHVSDPVAFINTLLEYLNDGGLLIIGTDNFDCDIVRTMGRTFPKWIPHQHISLFDERTLPQLISKFENLKVDSVFSFTPWELVAQKLARQLTFGKVGGKEFSLAAELSNENDKPFKFFELRKRINTLWVNLTVRNSLSGEMMFVVARKGHTAAP